MSNRCFKQSISRRSKAVISQPKTTKILDSQLTWQVVTIFNLGPFEQNVGQIGDNFSGRINTTFRSQMESDLFTLQISMTIFSHSTSIQNMGQIVDNFSGRLDTIYRSQMEYDILSTLKIPMMIFSHGAFQQNIVNWRQFH